MRFSEFSHFALGIYIAAAMLAGCGGSQPPIGAPFAMPEGPAIDQQAERGESWMLPEAKSDDLLYIGSEVAGTVSVFSYPAGKLVGTLTGFEEPTGLCLDKAGDVWVVNFAGANLVEYPHGGSVPIRTIHDTYGDPLGCAVNTITGDLAVADYYPASGIAGNVLVYPDGSGTPAVYTDSSVYNFSFCTYDGAGNLYADGEPAHVTGIVLAELPKGSAGLTNIKFRGTIGSSQAQPGAVQWIGDYLAIGSGSPNRSNAVVVYHVRVKGFMGKIVDATRLVGTRDPMGDQYWIQGSTIIAPTYYGYKKYAGKVRFYEYPNGGLPTKVLPRHFDWPYGVTVSLAPH